MTMDTKYLDKQLKAKKRVEDLKGFYWHLASYVAVNLFISTFKVVRDMGEGEPLWGLFGILAPSPFGFSGG